MGKSGQNTFKSLLKVTEMLTRYENYQVSIWERIKDLHIRIFFSWVQSLILWWANMRPSSIFDSEVKRDTLASRFPRWDL